MAAAIKAVIKRPRGGFDSASGPVPTGSHDWDDGACFPSESLGGCSQSVSHVSHLCSASRSLQEAGGIRRRHFDPPPLSLPQTGLDRRSKRARFYCTLKLTAWLKRIMARQPPPASLKPTLPSASTTTTATTTTTTVGEKLPSIPGFRTSAAFLTSLSANLRLPDEPFTPMSTPPSMRGSTELSAGHPLPPPSPLSSAIMTANDPPSHAKSAVHADLASIPDLSTSPAISNDEKVSALRLIADSVAQQRQVASRAILYHPLTLAAWVALIAVVGNWMYRGQGDLPLVATTVAGLTMAGLVAVRWATGGYIHAAEEVGWEWLDGDQVVVTRWGGDVIGALVVGWRVEGNGRRKRRGGRGVIRAWTVKLKYRNKGIGALLLEEAIQIVNSRGGDGLDFAEDHANSLRVLHPFFNGPFDAIERRAAAALGHLIDEKASFGKRR